MGIKGARADAEDALALDASDWAERADEIMAARPLRHVQLFKAVGSDLESALARDEMVGVERFALFRNKLGEAEVEMVINCPHLTTIREIDLKWCGLSGKSIAKFVGADPRRFPALRWLSFSGNKGGAIGVRAMTTSLLVQQLEFLDLDSFHAGDEAIGELFASPAVRNLQEIVLRNNEVSDAAREALLASEYTERLVRMDVFRRDDVKKYLAANARAKKPWTKPEKPKGKLVTAPSKLKKSVADDRSAGLIERVAANPDDEAARLVYSDWLQERTDPRGELMLLSAQCKQVDDEDLRIKEYKLRTKVESEFKQRFKNKQASVVFRHGMIVEVGGPQHWIIEHGAAMLAREPIGTIWLYPPSAGTMDKLVAIPGIRRLTCLSIMHATPKLLEALPLDAIPDTEIELGGLGSARNEGITPFLDMPQLARVKRLGFWENPELAELSKLSQDDRLAHLTHLKLLTYNAKLGDAVGELMLHAKWKLVHLALAGTSAPLMAKLRKKIGSVVDTNADDD